MRVVMVSGAFKGAAKWIVELNVRRAETVALELWKLGVAVICPHTNTRNFDGAAPEALWARGYLEILRRCDGLVLIPGWDKSEGARVENAFAGHNRIRVFQWPAEAAGFKRWLDEEAFGA